MQALKITVNVGKDKLFPSFGARRYFSCSEAKEKCTSYLLCVVML